MKRAKTERALVLTLAEAADLLKMSESTLRYWVQSGKLRASKLGRCWKIQEADIHALLDTYVHRPAATWGPNGKLVIPLLTERIARRRHKRHVG